MTATANPHDTDHTPGGSSSGAVGGVADFMVPRAFGTQTGGSVLRPSSYCGIVGYKPTFGTFNLAGVKPAAQSLDTLGLHARTLDDIALLTDVLVGRPPSPVRAPVAAPRIGLCRTYLWDAAEAATIAAVEDAAARLEDAGATIRDIELPDDFAGLSPAREAINAYERAKVMAHEWAHDRDRLSDKIRTTIAHGLELPYTDYLAALALAEDCRRRLPAMFDGLDILIAPCVDGEPPAGLDFAGNPRFQGLWTLLHVPTLTLPTHTGPNRLPVGVQIVAPFRADDRLLSAAKWVWDRLGPSAA